MVAHVEVVLVLPRRMPEPERGGHRALPVARHAREPHLDAADQVRERERAVEDRHAADVQRRVRALHVQEPRVERGHARGESRQLDGRHARIGSKRRARRIAARACHPRHEAA
jgi:hypothetical protein